MAQSMHARRRSEEPLASKRANRSLRSPVLAARGAPAHNALMSVPTATKPWQRFDSIRIADAAERVKGVVTRTPLVPLDAGDPRIELRGKMENRQVTGSFKA